MRLVYIRNVPNKPQYFQVVHIYDAFRYEALWKAQCEAAHA